MNIDEHDKEIKRGFDEIAAQKIAVQKFSAWQQTMIAELCQFYEGIITHYRAKCKLIEEQKK